MPRPDTADGRAPVDSGALLVFGAAALWGTLGLFGRILYAAGFTPIELAGTRALLGCLGLAIWAAPDPRRLRIPLRDLPFFIVYGTVAFGLFQYLYFAAVERISIAVAAALLYTAPAFVLLLSRLVDRQPIRRDQVGSLIVALLGVALATGAIRTLATRDAASLVGGLLGLGAGFTYGLYTFLSKRALDRHDRFRTIFYAFLFAALALLPASRPWNALVRAPEWIPALVALGLLPTLVAYLLYLSALRRMPAARASLLATVEPVVAGLLGWWILGETLSWDQAAGIGLVIAVAVYLARRREPTRIPAGGPDA